MMTHAQIKIFVTEAIILVVLSAVLIISGFVWSSSQANNRLQKEYRSSYKEVLDADSYSKITGEVLNNFPEINEAYVGYGKDGEPVGYVFDLTVESTSEPSNRLSFLIGIDYETSKVTGLTSTGILEGKKAKDREEREAARDKIAEVRRAIKGKQIPAAFARAPETIIRDNGAKTPVEGIKDGIYYAQRLYDDRSKYIDYVEIEVRGGYITKIQWDAFSTDLTSRNRREASLSGAYGTGGGGLDWATQAYNVCHALLELQDPQRLAMKSDGTTDIISGVTMDISVFVELTDECIENSKAGFTKDMYMEGLTALFKKVNRMDSEKAGVVNKDGYLAYSFKKTPELYTVYNDAKEVTGHLTLMEVLEKAKVDGDGKKDGGNDADAPGGGKSDAKNDASVKSDEDSTEPSGDSDGNAPGGESDGNQDAGANVGSGSDDGSDSGEDGVAGTDSTLPQNAEGGEDGLSHGADDDTRLLTDSIDDLPMSEIASYINPPADAYEEARMAIRSCNVCYKFLKAYLNWRV